MAAKFAVFFILALGLCSANLAGCTHGCRNAHNGWIAIARGVVANGGYYSTANETNCLVRTGFDWQEDPCWSMDCAEACSGSGNTGACLASCNESFQQCCLETAETNARIGLESCLAACNGVRSTAENGTCGVCEFYESDLGNCTCRMEIIDGGMYVESFSGSAYMGKFMGPDNYSIGTGDVFEAGDIIYTGSDGTVTVRMGNGTQFYELKLGPDQYAKHITVHSGNGTSEHAILKGSLAALETRMQVDENEPGGVGVPAYIKFADSYVEIFPEANQSAYEVRQEAGQVTIVVNSGAVHVGFANQSLVASAGDSVIASPNNLVKSGIGHDNGCFGAFVLALAAMFAFARKVHA